MTGLGEAFYFGPADRPLFGVYHPAEWARGTLVLCSPLGSEEVGAHRTLRHLAIQAADAGFNVLRFDHDGCGDSAGGEADADRWAGWVRSVHLAIDQAKRLSGHANVALLGIRIGAATALSAALSRTDIAALVVVAPVLQGRRYLRELKALAAAAALPGTRPGVVQAAGQAIFEPLQRELEGLDLTHPPHAPAPRLLLVERDDLPSAASPWIDVLKQAGCSTTTLRASGYTAMMADPHLTVVPTSLVDGVIEWLRGALPPESAASPPTDMAALRETMLQVDGRKLRECTVRIPAGDSSLFGLFTTAPNRAPAAAEAPSRPILLLNAGAVRAVGPYRQYAVLARRWAAQGHSVLRVDLTGLGESPARGDAADNVVYGRYAVQDVAAALDWLRHECNGQTPTVVGLCSGAYHAFKAAVAGQAIAEAVVINPLTFFWSEGMSLEVTQGNLEVTRRAQAYRRSIASGAQWLRLLKGEVNLLGMVRVLLLRAVTAVRDALRRVASRLGFRLEQDLPRELREAASRTRLTFVFADRDPGLQLLRAQGGRTVQALQRKGRLAIHVVDEADHTFTTLESRERLQAILDVVLQSSSGPFETRQTPEPIRARARVAPNEAS